MLSTLCDLGPINPTHQISSYLSIFNTSIKYVYAAFLIVINSSDITQFKETYTEIGFIGNNRESFLRKYLLRK